MKMEIRNGSKAIFLMQPLIIHTRLYYHGISLSQGKTEGFSIWNVIPEDFHAQDKLVDFPKRSKSGKKSREDIRLLFWRMSRQVDVVRRKSHRHTSAHMHVSKQKNTTRTKRWNVKEWAEIGDIFSVIILLPNNFPITRFLQRIDFIWTTHIKHVSHRFPSKNFFLKYLQIKLEREKIRERHQTYLSIRAIIFCIKGSENCISGIERGDHIEVIA